MEGPVGHDPGPGLLVDPHGAAEVIRVGVGDEDRVHVAGLQIRLPEPILNRLPGERPGQSGIDDRHAVPVHQRG